MNIYRSSNEPIIIEFSQSLSTIPALMIDLVSYSCGEQIIKTWTKDDVFIKDKYIIIPLTQSETASFPVGEAQIHMKWLDSHGFVIFANSLSLQIKSNANTSVMGDDSAIDYENLPVEQVVNQISYLYGTIKVKTNVATVDYDEALTDNEIDTIINWG